MSAENPGSAWNSKAAGGLVVALAVIGGLGIASGRAAPTLPTAFELSHRRILSVVGTHSGEVALSRKVRHKNEYGKPYFTYDRIGGVNLALDVTEQRGRRFTIRPVAIQGYGQPKGPYDEAPVLKDALAGKKKGTGRLVYRRKRVGRGQYAHFEEFVDWRSSTKLAKGTRVSLKGTAALGYQVDFDGKSTLSGGLTPKLAKRRASALIRGFRVTLGEALLHGDITWNDSTSGTVDFTSPSSLAGKKGTIRVSGKKYLVSGPKGFPAKCVIEEDGAGTVDLGLGKFSVGYGSFQLTE